MFGSLARFRPMALLGRKRSRKFNNSFLAPFSEPLLNLALTIHIIGLPSAAVSHNRHLSPPLTGMGSGRRESAMRMSSIISSLKIDPHEQFFHVRPYASAYWITNGYCEKCGKPILLPFAEWRDYSIFHRWPSWMCISTSNAYRWKQAPMIVWSSCQLVRFVH